MSNRIFITGGASGLGRAIAERWAQAGWKVCIGDINADRGAEVVAIINELGGEGRYEHVDVTNEQELQAVADRLVADWGGVDIVVNNAGIATGGRIENHKIEDWLAVLDINVVGIARGCKVFTPIFKQQGGGYFLNTSSMAGLIHPPGMASYNASKAGAVALSETLAIELSQDNIGVSVICPSFFKTNLEESLRTDDDEIRVMMSKLFKHAKLTSPDVAEACWKAVKKKQFHVIPLYQDRLIFNLKRVLPFKQYAEMMIKRTVARVKKK